MEQGDGYIGVYYIDEEKTIHWDYDGNVIYEGYSEDAKKQHFEGIILEVGEEYMLVQPYSKYWIKEITNEIYVSMNTEKGQTPEDFKDILPGEKIGVYFYKVTQDKATYQIDSVSELVVGETE